MNQNIIVKQQNIKYSINTTENTAYIIDGKKSFGDILIPRSIQFNGNEYPVTKICEESFLNSENIDSIRFAPNSEVRTIEKKAFYGSLIVGISIPSSLIELEENWCLENFNYSQEKNPRYSIYDDKFIVGKSNLEHENYDIQVFCKRDIKSVIIPSFIEIIGSCAFDNCFEIQSIEIPKDSKLRIIESYAFHDASITSFHEMLHIYMIGRFLAVIIFKILRYLMIQNLK